VSCPRSMVVTSTDFYLIVSDKHGISKTFLTYFHSIDSAAGQKTLGPDKTISAKVQEGVTAGIERAKTIDEQKGITKRAGDVSALFLF
jgi:hypothetical protein